MKLYNFTTFSLFIIKKDKMRDYIKRLLVEGVLDSKELNGLALGLNSNGDLYRFCLYEPSSKKVFAIMETKKNIFEGDKVFEVKLVKGEKNYGVTMYYIVLSVVDYLMPDTTILTNAKKIWNNFYSGIGKNKVNFHPIRGESRIAISLKSENKFDVSRLAKKNIMSGISSNELGEMISNYEYEGLIQEINGVLAPSLTNEPVNHGSRSNTDSTPKKYKLPYGYVIGTKNELGVFDGFYEQYVKHIITGETYKIHDGFYQNGERVGVWKTYNTEGDIIREKRFK